MNLEGPSSGCGGSRTYRRVQFTHYQHEEEVTEATGTHLMDCSEFVSYVLGRVAPLHLALIRRETGRWSPLAFEYYGYFSSLEAGSDGWQQINDLSGVHRGDLMAWRLVDHPQKGQRYRARIGGRRGAGVKEDGYYLVRTYDSSDIPPQRGLTPGWRHPGRQRDGQSRSRSDRQAHLVPVQSGRPVSFGSDRHRSVGNTLGAAAVRW
jgi:hypothetical protein